MSRPKRFWFMSILLASGIGLFTYERSHVSASVRDISPEKVGLVSGGADDCFTVGSEPCKVTPTACETDVLCVKAPGATKAHCPDDSMEERVNTTAFDKCEGADSGKTNCEDDAQAPKTACLKVVRCVNRNGSEGGGQYVSCVFSATDGKFYCPGGAGPAVSFKDEHPKKKLTGDDCKPKEE
jgi:hypothetical protein